jgi:hypothetical protein
MANPTCSQSNLLTQCYTTPGAITPKQQKALMVYAKALELAALGGTNYIGRTSLMLSDAASLGCGMLQPDRDASRIHLAFVNAMAAGAPVPTSINAKIAQILCFDSFDEQQMDEVDLMLTCKLGVHKAYPQ